MQRTLPEWCARPPFWKFLDDAGRRCIVMDAFMDARLPGFKGIEILEYGTWTWFFGALELPAQAAQRDRQTLRPHTHLVARHAGEDGVCLD